MELCSPKADDHFEVTKPLLFWKSIAGAQKYEVYIDDAKAGEEPAVGISVSHFDATQPLSVGAHRWFVKAIPATGAPVTSGTSSFTIDQPVETWPPWAIGPFQRYGGNPLIQPRGTGWESRNTYNPGVLFDEGRFRMLYRAQATGAWTSRVGYADSPDGVTFLRDTQPLIDVTESFETKSGCSDARFYKLGGTYYTFYEGNLPDKHIAECEATSVDGRTWKKLGVVVPGTKNCAVICDPNGAPVRIAGKFALYAGNDGFGIAYSDDMIHWGPFKRIDLHLAKGWVKPYEPCFAVTNYSKTNPDDVLLFIAGTLNGKGKWFYAISEVLLSKEGPYEEGGSTGRLHHETTGAVRERTIQELPLDEQHHPTRRLLDDVLRSRGSECRVGHCAGGVRCGNLRSGQTPARCAPTPCEVRGQEWK